VSKETVLYGTKKLFPEAAPFPERGDIEDVLKWIGELDEESLATPDMLRLQASVHRLRDARSLAAARAGLLMVQGTQVRGRPFTRRVRVPVRARGCQRRMHSIHPPRSLRPLLWSGQNG
jgi:hypothetical protein